MGRPVLLYLFQSMIDLKMMIATVLLVEVKHQTEMNMNMKKNKSMMMTMVQTSHLLRKAPN